MKPAAEPAPAPAGRRRFLINAFSAYGQRAAMGLSALVVTPYLFRTLGTGRFGTWAVMFTLVSVFAMLEEGFSLGTTKFVAAQRAEGQREEVETTLGASVMLMAGLGALGFAVCSLLGLFANGLAASGQEEAFRAGMIVLGAALLIRIPLVAYGAVLAGYQRYDYYYAAQVVTILSAGIGSIAFVAAGGGVFALAVVYGVALVAGAVCYFVFLRRLEPALRTRPRRSDRGARRLLLGFSSFTTLADSMRLVGNRLDAVVIAAIKDAAAAAPFAAASTFQTGIQTLTLPATKLMVPMTSELEAKNMRETVIRRLVLATRISLQVTMPVAIAAAFFSTDIIDLWLGSDAPAVTAHILTVMALSTLMLCGVPSNEVLIGLGRARTVAALASAEGLSNLALSIVLVTQYGAIGAAIGTLISSYLIGPSYFPFACRATGCPLPVLLRDGPGRAIVSSLPSVALMFVIWLLLPPGVGRLALGLTAGVGAAVLVGLAQIGPRRAITELRAGLGSATDGDSSAPEPTVERPV